jgi:hypothetical protein
VYATTFSYDLPSLCDKIAPTPLVDQSTSNIKALVKFGLIKISVPLMHQMHFGIVESM